MALVTNKLSNNSVEILFYGYIGEDINSKEFVSLLKNLEINNTKITLRIHSGGGSVIDGLAIFNAIRNSKAQIVGIVDGCCASMATVIAMACKSVFMQKNSLFMTHRAVSGALGNSDDLKNISALLETLEKSLSEIYAAKTGLTPNEARAKYMGYGDRWLTATDALAEKIIDGICEGAELPNNAFMQKLTSLIMSSCTDAETLAPLLSMSAHELYMNGKLPLLQKLSPLHYERKVHELKNNGKAPTFLDADHKSSVLNSLKKLTGRELYMQGKFEVLKELDPETYKLKYQEYFQSKS